MGAIALHDPTHLGNHPGYIFSDGFEDNGIIVIDERGEIEFKIRALYIGLNGVKFFTGGCLFVDMIDEHIVFIHHGMVLIFVGEKTAFLVVFDLV